VFAVADTLDALTTRRPYRQPSTISEARRIIEAANGTHFDPDVIVAFRTLPDDQIAEIGRRIG
jgi:ribonuclease P protein subunit RPR2